MHEQPAAIKINAWELARGLGNTVLFASRDRTLPPHYQCVQVQCHAATGRVLMVATDRYSVGMQPLAAESVSATAVAFIDTRDVKRIIRAVKESVTIPTLASLTISDGEVDVELADTRLHMTSTDGEFPDWSTILPDASEYTPCKTCAFNPDIVARFAKVNPAYDGAPLYLRALPDSHRPAMFAVGDFLAWVMPTSGGEPPWAGDDWHQPVSAQRCPECGAWLGPGEHPCPNHRK